MIEERIIEWLDLGDSIQIIDIYQKKKLLKFFKFYHLLVKHGIVSEVPDIIFQIIFFLQIINLSSVNIDSENDIILEILKYIEVVVIPYKMIKDAKTFLIISIIVWSINLIHLILTIVVFILLRKRVIVKILFFFISIINFIIYYYLIGPIIYLALSATLCTNGIHEFLQLKCYSDTTHIIFTILNFIFGLYSLFIIETFSLYYNQIGTIYGPNVKSRVNCDYDIYSSNSKLIIYIVVYFYRKYANNSAIFKYIYQIYIFLISFFLSIYAIKAVFYYNKRINIIIHFSWFFDTLFSLCMLLKICFNLNDVTLFVLFGLVLIIIVFIYQTIYSYYKRLTQLDLFNEKRLVYIERFNYELIDLYNSTKKADKLLLNGIIKKFEDYIISNPEFNDIFNKIKNDIYLRKKFFSLNELSMLAAIFTIYSYYLEKSEIKTDITLHMCYFLINKLKNPTFAIFLISKLKNNNHTQLYHKFVLMEKIKDYLIFKLNRKSFKNSINNVQMGKVILYYQYLDLFKLKIYDGTCNQIDYFDSLRNNINTGKVTENFLKTGENILNLRNEIFKIWEKIIELNPFSNESQGDFMLYLKTIMQDDIMAKEEEKKFTFIKSNKLAEKNNVYYSIFKNDINSILLIDGYLANGKILYATPNFPFLFKFNGKEIINTTIDEIIPNVIQPFHKDLMDNILKYSNIKNRFNKNFEIYLKGKNNSIFYVNIYVKPVPNLTFGLIYFTLLTKIQDHEFTLILDKDFKIDGFTEMNQGTNFTLNNNLSNNYNLSSQVINHHIGLIIPEILLQICYKDNVFYMEKNNIDIKGNLYSYNNLKDLDIKINMLLDSIKNKGFLNISENNDESRRALKEYNELKDNIMEKKNRSFSIFFKVDTRIFLDGKYRYHRLYVTNDNLYLTENINFVDNRTMNCSVSDYEGNKKNQEKLMTLGSFRIENEDIGPTKNKHLSIFYNKFLGNKDIDNINKTIKLKIPINKEIKSENFDKEKNLETINNVNNFIDNNNNNNVFENDINPSKKYTFEQKDKIDFSKFNRLKHEILNKKDSLQITVMKYVSLFFIIIIVVLVIYDYLFSKELYSNLVEYLTENFYFTHSKIINSCIYISSVNIQWIKYKYIYEYSCPINCTRFYLKMLEKCINNLKSKKDILYSYDPDFQDIIMIRSNLSFFVYNALPDILNLDLNDNLNIIISKGVKLIHSFNNYHNNYGKDQINMENLIHLSYLFFNSKIKGLTDDEKLSRVNQKFKNNYIRIIVGVVLSILLFGIFLYFIIYFNNLELFFLDKLIIFNSPNFENYLKVLEDLKKKLKNTKNEDEENNVDEIEYEINSNKDGNSKNTKEGKDMKKTIIKENKEGSDDISKKNINKKRGNKQNKIQQQRFKKKNIMSFYFYKENIFFAIKIAIILFFFVSFFIVSFIMYKYYFNNYLKFDSAGTDIEDLYYNSFKIFLDFKSELLKFQSNDSYTMIIPLGKDIQIPNFGNILNDLTQNSVYDKSNIEKLKQLYNGDLCLLLFYNETTLDYTNCKEFLSSILLKGMEQAIIQMGIMINNAIDELSLINDKNDFNITVYGNATNYKKYEMFIEYYLLLSYLKNEEIFNALRNDETQSVNNLTMEIIIVYIVVYLILITLLFYFIFMYKYIYISLLNFIAILSVKFIYDDEYFYQKIIEIENKLYK